MLDDPRFVTIRELASIVKIHPVALYERSRHDALPGQMRIGRCVRVNLDTFLDAVDVGPETRIDA